MRMIGRNWEDESLQNDIKFWPFNLVNDGGTLKIKVAEKLFSPEKILAELLKGLKKNAERELGIEIKKAVLTVPACFNYGQRQATIYAGNTAGLQVLEILNEPIAAAIVYKIQKTNDGSKNVLLFDWGKCTLNVAVMQMKPNEIKELAVKSHNSLGGDDFNREMMRYCAEQFSASNQIDVFSGKDDCDERVRIKARVVLRRLQSAVEAQKKVLSSTPTTTVTLDCLKNDQDLQVEVTRRKFDEINHTLFQKALDIVDKAISSSKIDKNNIDDIVLVGGSSQIVKVQSMLEDYFGGKSLNHSVPHDEAMAYGAALRAGMLLNGANTSYVSEFEDTYVQHLTLF